MRRVAFVLTVFIVWWAQLPLHAENELQNVVITEVMTASIESAAAEFIELYNPNDIPVQLTDWRVEYKSANGQNWHTKYTFEEFEAQPRGFILLATEELGLDENEVDGTFSGGLALAAGHIRIVAPDTLAEVESTNEQQFIVHDTVGWGNGADSAEEIAAVAADKSQSIKRLVDEDALFIDTNVNLDDFVVSNSPEPQRTAPVEEVIPPEEPEDPKDPDPGEPTEYPSLLISELFIDPDLPQTDADDEFVEIFNPHNFEINLEAYVVQTGSNLQYTFEIGDVVIAPRSYVALKSSATGLVLANSGGAAQLLAPDGSVAASIIRYESAKKGQSWSRLGGSYAWTTVVTPGEPNKPTPTHTQQPIAKAPTSKRTYAKVVITELLPDPISPKLDKTDEFVELYNPNTKAVQLEGYVLKTGKTLSTSHTFENIVLQPGQYVVVFSADSRISLGNSGGGAQLLDPNGDEKSRSDTYGDAPPGKSWALKSGTWQWTARPTPAAKNVIILSGKAEQQSDNNESSVAINPEVLSALSTPAAIPLRQANLGLVALAAGLAVIYGVYEYRFEIQSNYLQYRANRKARRKDS